jgi:hypothetical protein
MARAARAARHIGGGVAIRVTPWNQLTDLGQRVRDAINALGATTASTHVIVDLKDSPRLASHSLVRERLTDIDRFASVTVLAGVFPHDLTNYQPGIEAEPRQEWLTWRREHAATSEDQRFLAFGDYTTQCAHYRPSPAVPGSVSLRYTTDDAILVFRGRQSNSGAGLGYEQIHGHCRLLVRRADYDGAVFSDGDTRMFCWTDPTNGTGNPEQWRVAAITHHITHLIVQLQDAAGSSAAIRTWARAQGPTSCR